MKDDTMNTTRTKRSITQRAAPRAFLFVALSGALLATACGGSNSMAGQEAATADTSAGGEVGGAEESDSGAMIVQPLGPDQQGIVDGYGDDALALVQELSGTLELSAPDCGRAGELRDAICDLADRICDIADEHPEHADVTDKCDDGQTHCETARQNVEDSCD
ncbi:MAG: hypothetical protein JRH11_16555 [Deltaproteobacteria bacterium]|nr:hypothetical protein [Deltaproteobacteria bacterium]